MRQALLRTFFAPVPARDVGRFRLLYCSSIAVTLVIAPWLSAAVTVLSTHPEAFRPIKTFAWLGLGAVEPRALEWLRAALLVALGCAAAGWRARWSLAASAALFYLYFGMVHSAVKPPFMDTIGHFTESVPWVLLILALAPGVGRAGPAEVSGWPLQAVKLLLTIIYFGALYCKLDNSWRWADGVAFRTILLEKAMQYDLPRAYELAHRLDLCAAMSALCLLVEGAFGLVLVVPAAAGILAPAGLGMHAAMYATMNLNYFKYFAPMYWVFLARAPARAAPRFELRGALVLATIAVVNLYCIFTWSRAWPFTHWRFYPERHPVEQATAYRLQAVSAEGRGRWLTAEEALQPGVVTSYSFGRALLDGDSAWIRDRLRIVSEQLARRGAPERSLAVVKRQVSTGPDGRFRFLDVPVIVVAIPPIQPAAVSTR